MTGLWFVAGLIWGMLAVHWQAWSVERLEQGSELVTAAFGMIAGTVARLLATGVLLVVALWQGVPPALAFFGGWWIGRWIALWRAQRDQD